MSGRLRRPLTTGAGIGGLVPGFCLLFIVASALTAAVPSPESYFGQPMGTGHLVLARMVEALP